MLPGICRTLFWLDEADGLLLLIPRLGDEIVRVDLREGSVCELERLVRDEDEDLRFASARPGPAGTLLVLYERGLVCLEADGNVLWQSYPRRPSGDGQRRGWPGRIRTSEAVLEKLLNTVDKSTYSQAWL
jgi:hypothetical protein